jgi:AcrR family transcriptional regulator
MARIRHPGRLDNIADAATSVFISHGFGAARVADIAREAGVGPGTVYLYAEGKDALLDLALRRAFEDPTLLNPALPHQGHMGSADAFLSRGSRVGERRRFLTGAPAIRLFSVGACASL